MFVRYTAKRSIVPPHVNGTIYTLLLEPTQGVQMEMRTLQERQESINGKVETQFYGQLQIYNVELAPVTLHSGGRILREFLDSTADGHSFQFDPYGTPAEPSPYRVSCVREDEAYTEIRWLAVGEGGMTDYVQYRFAVRKIASL